MCCDSFVVFQLHGIAVQPLLVLLVCLAWLGSHYLQRHRETVALVVLSLVLLLVLSCSLR